jgi:hypothetical protein
MPKPGGARVLASPDIAGGVSTSVALNIATLAASGDVRHALLDATTLLGHGMRDRMQQ